MKIKLDNTIKQILQLFFKVTQSIANQVLALLSYSNVVVKSMRSEDLCPTQQEWNCQNMPLITDVNTHYAMKVYSQYFTGLGI